MTEEKIITIYRSEYLPMQEGDDEPEKISERTDVLKVADYAEDLMYYWPDDSLIAVTEVRAAVELLDSYTGEFCCAGASSCPTDGVGVWYSDQGYADNYTGVRHEATAHLSGFTEDEQREIYATLKERKRVQ